MADAQELSRITTFEQLDTFFKASSEGPVWLFKHSLICPTSATAWREFEEFANRQSDRARIGVIEIQRAREVSKEVALRTGVRHQSPQALLIRDGEVVWHASHWAINKSALDKAVEQGSAYSNGAAVSGR